MAEPSDAVRHYYEGVTTEYLRYGGEGGWHYGISEGGQYDHAAALQRSTELLFEGLEIDETTRILDVGCGVGDLARFCARSFGCRVAGITVSPAHVALAKQRCAAAGVGELCTFEVMDMNDMSFADSRFDIVVNQDSLCYATDVEAYFEAVRAVLGPCGVWSAIAFSRVDELPSERARQEYVETLAGFCIDHLCPPSEISDALSAAGFVDKRAADLTALAAPTAAWLLQMAQNVESLMAVAGDWAIGNPDSSRDHQVGHFAAGLAYSSGLLGGWARHMQYRAVAP